MADGLEVSVEELMKAFSDSPGVQIPGLSNDPELAELLSNVAVLEDRDKVALKTVLEAMFVRYSMKEMANQPLQSLRHR